MAWAPQLQGSTCPHLRAMRATADGQAELRFLVQQHRLSSHVFHRMVHYAHRLDSPLATDGRCNTKASGGDIPSPRSVAAGGGGGLRASVADEDLHVCLHCSYAGTRRAVHGRPLQRHLIATGHVYAVRVATASEFYEACVWCSRCGDYVYDTIFSASGDAGSSSSGVWTLATGGRSAAATAQKIHPRSLVSYNASPRESGATGEEEASFLEPQQWATLMQAGLVPALRPTGFVIPPAALPAPTPAAAMQLSASVRASVGLRGLYNMGNTCFMSCVLQGLVQCPLLQGLLRSPRVRKLHRADRCPVAKRSGIGAHVDPSPCLACALVSFFDAMFSPPPLPLPLPPPEPPHSSAMVDKEEDEPRAAGAEMKAFDASRYKDENQKSCMNKPCPPIAPHALLHALWCRVSRLASYAQHDAHEFLVALLEVAGEDLKTADALSNGPPSAHESSDEQLCSARAAEPASTAATATATATTATATATATARVAENLPNPLDQVFSGELCSTVTCGHCGNSSQKREPFVDLSLPLPGDGFAGGSRSGSGGPKNSKSSGRSRAREHDGSGNGSGYYEPEWKEDPSMERVPLWNRMKRVCMRGMSAPRRGRLEEYLQTHPHCEVYVNQDGKQAVSLNTKSGGQRSNSTNGTGGTTNASGPGNTGTGRDKNKKRALLRERKKRLQAEAEAAAAAAAGCSGTCNLPSGAKSLRAFVSEGPVGCDSCGQGFNEGSSFFGCRICNYDLCLGCHTKAVGAIDEKTAAETKDGGIAGDGPGETSMDNSVDDAAATNDQMANDDSGMKKDDADNNDEVVNDDHENEETEIAGKNAENDDQNGMDNTEENNASGTSFDEGNECGSVDGMQEVRKEEERNNSFDDSRNDGEMRDGQDRPDAGTQNGSATDQAADGGTEGAGAAAASDAKSNVSSAAAAAATAPAGAAAGATSAQPHPSATSLQACLAQFTAPEYLNESAGFWCDACNCRRSASKQLTLSRLPNALVIHLKRFDGVSDSKRADPVTFPTLSLDLAPFTTAPSCSSSSSKEESGHLPENSPEKQPQEVPNASGADTTKINSQPPETASNSIVEAVISESGTSSLEQTSSPTLSASTSTIPAAMEDKGASSKDYGMGDATNEGTATFEPSPVASAEGALPPPPQLQRKLTAREEFAAMAAAGKAAAAGAVAQRSVARRGSLGNSIATSNGSVHGDDTLPTGEGAASAVGTDTSVLQEAQEDNSAASQVINLLANSGTARGLPSSSCELLYDLSAVVHHTGNLGKGHYTATVASPLGGWWACDDASVEPIVVEAPAAAAASEHNAAPTESDTDDTLATAAARSSANGDDACIATAAGVAGANTTALAPAPTQSTGRGANNVANGPYAVPGDKASGSAYILFYVRRKYSTHGVLNPSRSSVLSANAKVPAVPLKE